MISGAGRVKLGSMSLPTRRSALALAAAAVAVPGMAVAESRTGRLRDGFPYLREYYAIPAAERSAFVTAYYVELDGRPATGVSATIIRGERRTPVTLGPLGRITQLPSAQELASDARLEVTWPTGRRLSVNMRLEPSVRPSTHHPAFELINAVEQASRGVRRVLGIMGMAAPRLTRVAAIGASSGEVQMPPSGDFHVLPIRDGAPSFAPAMFPGAQAVNFRRTPVRLQILSD